MRATSKTQTEAAPWELNSASFSRFRQRRGYGKYLSLFFAVRKAAGRASWPVVLMASGCRVGSLRGGGAASETPTPSRGPSASRPSVSFLRVRLQPHGPGLSAFQEKQGPAFSWETSKWWEMDIFEASLGHRHVMSFASASPGTGQTGSRGRCPSHEWEEPPFRVDRSGPGPPG